MQIQHIRAGYWRETGRRFWAGESMMARPHGGISHIPQKLRSVSNPLQSWQGKLFALEDETPLELPPGASGVKTFAFHNQVCPQA